jgi:adenylate cyclase
MGHDPLRDLLQSAPSAPALTFALWVERLASVGIVSHEPQVVRAQRCVNVAAIATAADALSHLVLNVFHDFEGLLPVNLYNLALALLAAYVPRLHRHGNTLGAIVLITAIGIGNVFAVWALGSNSDLQVYFTLAGAMIFLLGPRNWQLFLFFFALALTSLLICLHLAPVDGLLIPDDTKLRDMLSHHANINTIIINAAIAFYAVITIRQAEKKLEGEYLRSEVLIGAVLPLDVAARLKAGQTRIADRFEGLSVLFADLVGFTEAARDVSPDAVVQYLDALVRDFDALCAQYGVEKVKTIGDAYMAAVGFDGRSAQSAITLSYLALEMLEATARQPSLGGRKLEIRIGMHCGSATAGVIGDTRFSYDIWGDAVNVAARMESHSEPGRILVSAHFRELTAGSFTFEEQPPTEIKGIGLTKTFLLIGSVSAKPARNTESHTASATSS